MSTTIASALYWSTFRDPLRHLLQLAVALAVNFVPADASASLITYVLSDTVLVTNPSTQQSAKEHIGAVFPFDISATNHNPNNFSIVIGGGPVFSDTFDFSHGFSGLRFCASDAQDSDFCINFSPASTAELLLVDSYGFSNNSGGPNFSIVSLSFEPAAVPVPIDEPAMLSALTMALVILGFARHRSPLRN